MYSKIHAFLANQQRKMLKQRIKNLTEKHKKTFPQNTSPIYTVISPLRICPLGAHIDHQGGLVTGMPVGEPNILVFSESTNSEVKIQSLNFEGEASFNITDNLSKSELGWENYARGATEALKSEYNLSKGFLGVIEGSTPIGGLSSSASVGVAYLLALEKVNNLDITKEKNIDLDSKIENGFLGLKNGILDQSIILMGQATSLTFLDCNNVEFKQIQPNKRMNDYEIIVAYSGLSKSLISSSDYNNRVTECLEAAQILCEKGNIKTKVPPKLRDVPLEIWETYKNTLPKVLQKRAGHFFTEMNRVQKGVEYWKNGDIQGFGECINLSCQSSIENYESGSPHLISLQKILQGCKGVYGSRFSGAGFRGSCIGLVNPAYKQEIIGAIEREYPKLHPEVKNEYKILFTKQIDSACVI